MTTPKGPGEKPTQSGTGTAQEQRTAQEDEALAFESAVEHADEGEGNVQNADPDETTEKAQNKVREVMERPMPTLEMCGDDIINGPEQLDEGPPNNKPCEPAYSTSTAWCEVKYDHAPAFEPALETSCDGLDNDCDGEVDEGCISAKGTTCHNIGLYPPNHEPLLPETIADKTLQASKIVLNKDGKITVSTPVSTGRTPVPVTPRPRPLQKKFSRKHEEAQDRRLAALERSADDDEAVDTRQDGDIGVNEEEVRTNRANINAINGILNKHKLSDDGRIISQRAKDLAREE